MAQLVQATNIQKMEFDVTTSEGPGRVTIVTGTLPASVSTQGTGPQTASFKAIVDPVLAPGQFRKATATASLTGTGFVGHVDPNMPNQVAAQWSIDEVEATLDDETGGIEVRIEVTVSANAQGFSASVQALGIQVTTLARV